MMTGLVIKKSVVPREEVHLQSLDQVLTDFASRLAFVNEHEMQRMLRFFQFRASNSTSNGGCLREEKSCKHWSLFTKLLFSVTANLSTCKIKSKALACIGCTVNPRNIGLSQMS